MAKEITAKVKLQIPAGKANPAPPVGSTLGQYGVPIMDFCNKFNSKTSAMGDVIVPVEITIFKDRSFDFIMKKPPAAFLIKKAAGIEKGSGVPNKDIVAKITKSQLKEIAEQKMDDLNAYDVDQAMKIIAGTAKQMGVQVQD